MSRAIIPNMRRNTVILIISIIALAAFFVMYYWPRHVPTDESQSGLMIGKDAIFVSDQEPSDHVAVGFAVLGKPGFVVIYDEKDEKLARILGASPLLPPGETSNLRPIFLSRKTVNGEMLSAVLYSDDGDGVFDSAKDIPVQDVLGEPLLMHFSIDEEAKTPDAVNF
jgi:hypothetical protein